MKNLNKVFTLTEGTPCFEYLWKVRQAFTLAEVLITLLIIGVVAALTIPTLIAKINEKVSENRQTTIEARLLDGINRYSTMEDGLSKPYETTYDFLVGLSKHYKMAQICKADEITNCIPYSEINYEKNNAPATVEVKSLKSVDALLTNTAADKYLAPASFITAQGTPVIMAFKKDCAWDTGKAMRSIEDSGCIAYMYDENGTRLPNKYGVDIISHGLTITGKGTPLAILGGVKIMTNAFVISNGLSLSECQEEAAKNYGITQCEDLSANGGDRWAYAMKYCKEQGYHLPTDQQLVDMANALYIGMSASTSIGTTTYAGKDSNYQYYTIGSKTPKPTALSGLGSSWYYLWSGSEYSSDRAYNRAFYSTYSRNDHCKRYDTIANAVCVSD